MSRFILGDAGTGKTAELLKRADEAAATSGILLTAGGGGPLDELRRRAGNCAPHVRSLQDVALQVLGGGEIIDDVRAAQIFSASARPLLDMQWPELLQEIDPEVPGLQSPQRFLDAAFRLFCKLRDALISPDTFLVSAQRGATQFYAQPPNFASADLLHYTKETYRDSLAVDAAELRRQYRREIDLAKILTKLYREYLEHPVRQGCLTPRDAIAQAAAACAADASAGAKMKTAAPLAFVDDAQELTIGELTLLQGIYGENLDGVTFAGDKESAVNTFRGARPDRVFSIAGVRDVLETQHRVPACIDVAARHLSGGIETPSAIAAEGSLQLFRATTQSAEAEFIAEYVVGLLTSGATHDDVAVIFRSVDNVPMYRDALLRHNVRCQVAGDANLFSDSYALDALAALWTLYNPYRHEYLLRVLQSPRYGLSDASLQVLCSEVPDAQRPLFNELPGAASDVRSGRWDSKRDVRLALNVLRGERDGDLSETARDRLQSFRASRDEWVEAWRAMPLETLARLVWSQALARTGAPDGAAARYQQRILSLLLDAMAQFSARAGAASLGEFLEYAEQHARAAFEPAHFDQVAGSVRLLSVEAARGREFDHVVLPNVRAGSFPRWYVPDAFLYSPSLGMIPKDNVGDAATARTAKFTYYMWRMKTRDAYNREERRAFVYALRRARKSALVTGSGRASRGVAAPELLHELQAARLPGIEDVSDRWRPARNRYAG